MAIGQSLQIIEHVCDVTRHTCLIGLAMVGLGSRLIAFLAQGRAQAFKFQIDDQVYDALQKTRDGERGR